MATDSVGRIEIVFGAKDGIYRPGERLTGNLEIELKQTTTIHAIKIQLKGRACWTGDTRKEGSVEKVFFNRDMVLFDRPPGALPGDFTWNQGKHVLPFECPLPKNCGTSYEGTHAFVRYFCRGTLVRSKGQGAKSKETNYVTKAPFTILGDPPASVDPALFKGSAVSESMVISGFCCSKGKICGNLTIHKSCYVPGEKVFGSFKLENKSRMEVDGVFCRIVEELSRPGKSESSALRRVLVESRLEDSEMKARQNYSRDNVLLIQIPPLAPSSPLQPQAGGIFSLEYHLEIVCGKLSVQIPIVVGSIPLSLEDRAPVATSYQEFILGPQPIAEADDPSDIQGNLSFAPVYPVFESGTYIPSREVPPKKSPTPIVSQQPDEPVTEAENGSILANGQSNSVEQISSEVVEEEQLPAAIQSP